jgi:hypothetical protein
MTATVLIIACGALAHELVELKRRNRWTHVRVRCLPHRLHNTPGRIAGEVRAVIERERDRHSRIFVAYADCGTFGALDRVLAEYGVERLPGAHCYEAYSGRQAFATMADEEPGSFYLTDFLARHFDQLVRHGLGLDRRPELLPEYFGRYRRLVFLSQSGSDALRNMARSHASYLGLEFVERATGLSALSRAIERHV